MLRSGRGCFCTDSLLLEQGPLYRWLSNSFIRLRYARFFASSYSLCKFIFDSLRGPIGMIFLEALSGDGSLFIYSYINFGDFLVKSAFREPCNLPLVYEVSLPAHGHAIHSLVLAPENLPVCGEWALLAFDFYPTMRGCGFGRGWFRFGFLALRCSLLNFKLNI